MLFRPDAVSRINSVRSLSVFNSEMSDLILGQMYKKHGHNLFLHYVKGGFNPFKYFHSDDFYQFRDVELSMKMKWFLDRRSYYTIPMSHRLFTIRLFSDIVDTIIPISYRKNRYEKHE